LGEALPTGTAKGTIILVSGAGGTAFLNSGFGSAYIGDGFRVVQLAWTTYWEDTGGVGLKSASCRGATVFKYVFDNVHGGDRTTGFCAQGTSGGGAAITCSHRAIRSVGGVGDQGTQVEGSASVQRFVAAVIHASNAGTGGNYDVIEKIREAVENTTTCGAKSPLSSDIKKWAADSIVTAGVNFTYPKTAMSWYFCATPPVNNSTGEGKFLIDRVIPKNNPPDVSCYSGVCKDEAVWQDPNAFNATQNEMIAQCVPNHQ
jgi:hypothetical protein